MSFQFHTNVNMCHFIWICQYYFKRLTCFFLLRLNYFPINFFPLNTQFKDLIPTCLIDLMFIHPNCFQTFNELKIGVADEILPWMIIGLYFVQFESYIYLKITKFSNVNLFFFFFFFFGHFIIKLFYKFPNFLKNLKPSYWKFQKLIVQ